MIEGLQPREGEIFLGLEICSDDNDTGPLAGQWCSYTIAIRTSHRVIEISGCHDMGPEMKTIDRCDAAG